MSAALVYHNLQLALATEVSVGRVTCPNMAEDLTQLLNDIITRTSICNIQDTMCIR